jgi:hypothetical protein
MQVRASRSKNEELSKGKEEVIQEQARQSSKLEQLTADNRSTIIFFKSFMPGQ